MEIFVNKKASNSILFADFLELLTEKDGYKVVPNTNSNQGSNYYIINNVDKCIHSEGRVRETRDLSHYLLLDNEADVAKVLSMIRNEVFTRSNSGKPQWSLMHFDAFEPMIKVLEAGAEKYDRDNWKKGDLTQKQQLELWESTFRHVKAIKEGIETGDLDKIYDKDLGTNHIGNAMCNLMFLSYHLIEKGDQEIFKPNK